MLTIEDIIKRLKDRQPTKIAEETGLAYQTIWKIRTGRTKNVTYETLKALSDYLEEHP